MLELGRDSLVRYTAQNSGVAPRGAVDGWSHSTYVRGGDNTRLAVDVHLPPTAVPGQRFPTILRQTRYYRSLELRRWARLAGLEPHLDNAVTTRRRFLAAGYAWIDACVRGSGASFGSRPSPWSPEEVADGAAIASWIVRQPWCNGLVGATGISYDGTCAEFLGSTMHPAVRAVAPRFSLFDVFTDVAFPGGIALDWFLQNWSFFNRALDLGNYERALAAILQIQLAALAESRGKEQLRVAVTHPWAAAGLRRIGRGIARGVRSVEEDQRRLAEALGEHVHNSDVYEMAKSVTFRDDDNVSSLHPETTINSFSPHTKVGQLDDQRMAVLSMSGWHDGGYQQAAAHRHRSLGNAARHLVLGPWDHGGRQYASPFADRVESCFDQDGLLLAFFDKYLKFEERELPQVAYFVQGSELWRESTTWPPQSVRMQSWRLTEQCALVQARLGASSESTREAAKVHELEVNPTLGTGSRTRWNSLLSLRLPVAYADRQVAARTSLVFRSAPLTRGVTLIGAPIVELELATPSDDAQVFVYLEEETPGGTVRVVTEGMQRLLHGETTDSEPVYAWDGPWRDYRRRSGHALPREFQCVKVQMLPIAWHFAAGTRLRVAICGADADHFGSEGQAKRFAVRTEATAKAGSQLVLPVEFARI